MGNGSCGRAAYIAKKAGSTGGGPGGVRPPVETHAVNERGRPTTKARRVIDGCNFFSNYVNIAAPLLRPDSWQWCGQERPGSHARLKRCNPASVSASELGSGPAGIGLFSRRRSAGTAAAFR
jgi:hypothetical protein